MQIPEIELNQMVENILTSKKYRDQKIPPETVLDILGREIQLKTTKKAALQAARKKLHQVVAAYLGNPDYQEAVKGLQIAFASNDEKNIKQACKAILLQHTSTRERMEYVQEFYTAIFAKTGMPKSVLDLACGLNPFALPWMNLPANCAYHAYDIHAQRIQLINTFFKSSGRQALGYVRDILVNPPREHADVAFFFKEAHRMEKRRKGSNQFLWQAVNVDHLVVSLPIRSMGRKRDLTQSMRKLVYTITEKQPWEMEEIAFRDELVFCIKKG